MPKSLRPGLLDLASKRAARWGKPTDKGPWRPAAQPSFLALSLVFRGRLSISGFNWRDIDPDVNPVPRRAFPALCPTRG
jgi:hypothetical protein